MENSLTTLVVSFRESNCDSAVTDVGNRTLQAIIVSLGLVYRTHFSCNRIFLSARLGTNPLRVPGRLHGRGVCQKFQLLGSHYRLVQGSNYCICVNCRNSFPTTGSHAGY